MFGSYEHNCTKDGTKGNLTVFESDFEIGSRHDFGYSWSDHSVLYPFIISDRHSPDITVPENLPNSVPSGEDLILNGQIRNLDGNLDAWIYAQLDEYIPKPYEHI